MAKSVNKLNRKNQSCWFSYVNLLLWFPICFFLFYVNWFQQIPRDYKSFINIRQHLFNPIIAMSRDTDVPPGLGRAPNRKHTFHFNSLHFYSFNLLFAPKFVQKTISLILYVCICLDGKDLYTLLPHCYFVINFTKVFVHGSLALSRWQWIIKEDTYALQM